MRIVNLPGILGLFGMVGTHLDEVVELIEELFAGRMDVRVALADGLEERLMVVDGSLQRRDVRAVGNGGGDVQVVAPLAHILHVGLGLLLEDHGQPEDVGPLVEASGKVFPSFVQTSSNHPDMLGSVMVPLDQFGGVRQYPVDVGEHVLQKKNVFVKCNI